MLTPYSHQQFRTGGLLVAVGRSGDIYVCNHYNKA
jgi:hypothetical protein